ncbi:hypothetical protein [Nocardia sp. NPDC059239]|uniref:hypothetical protein n=1 Tax=Nocardia sp. NPDC059239 TaxID=3346785 RepID=UPI00368F1EB0
MSTHGEQAERHTIAHQLDLATSEAKSAVRDLGEWCDYATFSDHARDAAGLRALTGLEAVIGDLTAVFERLAAAVADLARSSARPSRTAYR